MPDQRDITIPVGAAKLAGTLIVPANARGLVLFAHGSGSSRHSSRNTYVAGVLNEADFGTLLMDLLTEHEETEDALTGQWRFDINLLSERVMAATDWLVANPQTLSLPTGYFGASTGAAAALSAAAERPSQVRAIVSRGGRPDLAGENLARVRAPTLLIVGGNDQPVIELNRLAFSQLQVQKGFEVVQGATHLFEEPGKLEQVAALARQWFESYLK